MNKLYLGKVLLPLTVIALFAGCAQKQYKFEYEHKTGREPEQKALVNEPQLVWPLEPEIARYRYLGEIVGESNFKPIKNSEGSLRKGLSWLADVIFGEAPPLFLYRPQSGFFDNKKQRMFVTDVGHKNVFVFDFVSGKVERWEGGDAGQNFKTPIAVVVLDNELVLITDADLGLVLRFDTEGRFLGSIGEGKLSRPTGLTYDPVTKKIFVADSKRHEIHVFDQAGNWLFAFGGKGAVNGKFNSPTHLAFDRDVLIVSDTLNARVQFFDAKGKWLRSFGERGINVGNMPRPKGVATDSDGNVYVVESYYDHLLMFNEQGEGLMAIGGTGKAPGNFDLPAGVWADDTNRIYVADMFNNRITVYQYLSVKNEQKQSVENK